MTTNSKILVFAASTSSSSINRQLVKHAADVLEQEIHQEVSTTLLDLNDFETAIYSADREAATGIPDKAKEFFALIGESDALLIAYAEHNGHYTAAYKNLFDWCSRIDRKVYQDKPMLIMAASPGPGGGANVLRAATESAPHFGADVKGSLSVGRFADTFNSETGVLEDATLAASLREQLGKLL